jgi:hypothetical protein
VASNQPTQTRDMQELTGYPGAGYLNSHPKKKEEAKLVDVSYLPKYLPASIF